MRVISFTEYLLFCIFFTVLCRPKFIMSTRELNCSEPSVINDDVESAIDRLQTVLHKNYLTAERVTALRGPNADALKAFGDTINVTFNELLGIMSIGGGTGGAVRALAPPLFFQGRPWGGLIYAFISTILPLHKCI